VNLVLDYQTERMMNERMYESKTLWLHYSVECIFPFYRYRQIKYLGELRCLNCADMVSFTIVLMEDGRENDVIPINCPGKKPLIDHVRPILTSKHHSRSNGIVLELDVRSTANVNWSSPAKEFAVSLTSP